MTAGIDLERCDTVFFFTGDLVGFRAKFLKRRP